MAKRRKKRKKLGRLTGGTEVPLSSKDSLLIGRKHEQGGIKDKRRGVELEDNETVSRLSNGKLFVGSDTVKNPESGRTFAEDFKDIGEMARRRVPGINKMRDQLAMKQEMVKSGKVPNLKKMQDGGSIVGPQGEYKTFTELVNADPLQFARLMHKINQTTGGDRTKQIEAINSLGINDYSDFNRASHILHKQYPRGRVGDVTFRSNAGTDYGNTTLAKVQGVPHNYGVYQNLSEGFTSSFQRDPVSNIKPLEPRGFAETKTPPTRIPKIGSPPIGGSPGGSIPDGVSIAPFLDNISAIALQDNRGAPTTRQQSYLSPALRTNTEELRQIGEQSRNLTRLAQRQNVNQGVLNASLGNLQAARSKAVTASEVAKDQFNIPVINQFRQANANIEAANIQRQLQDETRAFQLGSDRRAQRQQNIADIGKDIQGIQRDQEARDLDDFQMRILARQYGVDPNQIPRRRRRGLGINSPKIDLSDITLPRPDGSGQPIYDALLNIRKNRHRGAAEPIGNTGFVNPIPTPTMNKAINTDYRRNQILDTEEEYVPMIGRLQMGGRLNKYGKRKKRSRKNNR